MTLNITNVLTVNHFIPALEEEQVQTVLIVATLLIRCLFIRAIVVVLMERALVLIILHTIRRL